MAELASHADDWASRLSADGSGDGNEDWPVGDLMHGIVWFGGIYESSHPDDVVDGAALLTLAVRFCFAEPLLAARSQARVASFATLRPTPA